MDTDAAESHSFGELLTAVTLPPSRSVSAKRALYLLQSLSLSLLNSVPYSSLIWVHVVDGTEIKSRTLAARESEKFPFQLSSLCNEGVPHRALGVDVE